MKKKNIIQFIPYFPPHIWGVEKVWEDIFLRWTYWRSIVFYWEIGDNEGVYNEGDNINIDNKKYIWYPSFDIVDNFPIPLLWTKRYRFAIKKLEELIDENKDEDFYIITHTRFFLSSLMWWRFAKKNNLKWIHIEHGSDYVKLSSKFKSRIAYFYDKSIWKYIFKKSDTVLAISHAAEKFIRTEFWKTNVNVWYRGIDFPIIGVKDDSKIKIIFVWRLVHLKWVHILLEAFSKSKINNTLIIFWNGEEKNNLELLSKKLWIEKRVIFKGFVDSTEINKYISKNRCILVNPSYQEWMPTTVIEALSTKNIVIATDVGGTKEISSSEDLILFKSWDIQSLTQKLWEAIKKYSDLEGKSYNHIYERFSWDKSLEKLYKYLD